MNFAGRFEPHPVKNRIGLGGRPNPAAFYPYSAGGVELRAYSQHPVFLWTPPGFASRRPAWMRRIPGGVRVGVMDPAAIHGERNNPGLSTGGKLVVDSLTFLLPA